MTIWVNICPVNNLHSFPINVYLSAKIHLSPAQIVGVEARPVTPKTIFAISGMTYVSKNVPDAYKQLSSWNVLKEIQSICHAAGLIYHPWCQTIALWRALVFFDQETPVMLVMQWESNSWGGWILNLTWLPGIRARESALFLASTSSLDRWVYELYVS